MVAEISGTTLWRWLNADALRPWQHRSWIFPRDPDFAAKAGRVLDLYERRWEGVPLRPTDFVISADEKTSVQARRRKQPTLPGASGRPMRVEHEYFREGAWTYLAAWDVHRAKLFGRCENKSGIAPTHRLMAEVMTQEPYQSAHRVFWIMDNCSAHRGQKAAQRIRSHWCPTPSWCTPRSTPVGSTKSKSTSPSSRERCLLPMTFYPWPSSSSDYWPSKSIISKLLLPFSGPSLARILTPC